MSSLLQKDRNIGDYRTIEPKRVVPEEEYLLGGDPKPVPTEDDYLQGNAPQVQNVTKFVEPAQQQVNSGEQITSQPAQVQTEQQPQGGERIKSIYEKLRSSNAQPPKPEFDSKAPEYMKRTARMNALARGLSTLGDAFSLAKGGNVPQATKDTDTGRYVDNYFGYLDKYRKDMDDYRQQDYLHNMRLAEMMRQQGNRDEDIAWRNKQFDYGVEQDKAQQERQGKLDEIAGQRAKQDDDFKREQLEWDKQKPYVNHKLMTEREQQKADLALKQAMSKVSLDEKTGGFNLYDETGNLVKSIDKGMMNRLVNTILQDPAVKELAKNDLNLMRGQFEGLSTNAMNSIIAFYWNQSPEAMKLLGTQQQKTQATGNIPAFGRPDYNGPVRQPGQTASIPAQAQPQVQQPTSQVIPQAAPTQPIQQQPTSDTARIQQEYGSMGVDINNGSDYQNAIKIAEKQGIITPNTQPTKQQLAKVAEIAKKITQDKEALATEKILEGVGMQSTSQQQSYSTGGYY